MSVKSNFSLPFCSNISEFFSRKYLSIIDFSLHLRYSARSIIMGAESHALPIFEPMTYRLSVSLYSTSCFMLSGRRRSAGFCRRSS